MKTNTDSNPSFILLTLLTLLLFTGCGEDNFDLTMEVEDPRQTVIVEEYEIFFRHGPDRDSEPVDTVGQAVVGRDGIGMFVTTILGERSVECNENGSYGLTASGQGGFFLHILNVYDAEPFVVGFNLIGHPGTTNGLGFHRSECGSSVVDLAFPNDSIVSGTVSMEVFDLPNFSRLDEMLSAPCDSLVSVGFYDVEFVVPAIFCE